MLTEKDYCDRDTCVALMEIGYNAPQRLIPDYFGVFAEPQYDERIHLYDAQKFLREEKSIYVTVGCPQIMNEGLGWSYEVCDKPWNGHSDDDCVKASGGAYDSYEEALSEGVKCAVKILKEK
jgi:hypothetical protein